MTQWLMYPYMLQNLFIYIYISVLEFLYIIALNKLNYHSYKTYNNIVCIESLHAIVYR